MANTPASSIPWPRLVAEFLVIVVGVVVALGVDQWVSARDERGLEAEYLERLLADVEYDLAELTFIRERSALSARLGRIALDSSFVRRAAPDSLVGVAISALITRAPDLSRATFNELLNSGHIALIESREVREALADYDRAIAEYIEFFGLTAFGGLLWTWERVPPEQRLAYEAECRGSPEANSRIVLAVCPFQWEFDVPAFRADLLRGEVRHLLRVTSNRNISAVTVTDELSRSAEQLRRVLASSVD